MTAVRRPSVLAYRAVRDADTAEDAKRVYAAVKSAACYPADACALDGACPFYVDCVAAGDGTTEPVSFT